MDDSKIEFMNLSEFSKYELEEMEKKKIEFSKLKSKLDNNAIKNGFEDNWGKLIEMGFEIIQTDWPALVKGFVAK